MLHFVNFYRKICNGILGTGSKQLLTTSSNITFHSLIWMGIIFQVIFIHIHHPTYQTLTNSVVQTGVAKIATMMTSTSVLVVSPLFKTFLALTTTATVFPASTLLPELPTKTFTAQKSDKWELQFSAEALVLTLKLTLTGTKTHV